MANLKGTGAPTKKTVAAIGDIYTDTTTGKQYKCTFAYRTDNDTDFDCSWVELKGVKEEEPVEETKDEPVEKKRTGSAKNAKDTKPYKLCGLWQEKLNNEANEAGTE